MLWLFWLFWLLGAFMYRGPGTGRGLGHGGMLRGGSFGPVGGIDSGRGFDPEAVARFGPDDVSRLLADAGIVRNRAKIEAAIANAKAALDLPEGLSDRVWKYAGEPGPAPVTLADVPAVTPASKALAKDLRTAGFRFTGPVTAYATMQACGVVNDHLADCFCRDAASKP